METLPQVVQDLLRAYPQQVRDALRRLQTNPDLQSASFLDRDGATITIERVHPS
jgi:hypothetical protein